MRTKRLLAAGVLAAGLLVAPAALGMTDIGTAYAARPNIGPTTHPAGGAGALGTFSNDGKTIGTSDGNPHSYTNAECQTLADYFVDDMLQADQAGARGDDAAEAKFRTRAYNDLAVGRNGGCTFSVE